MGRNKKRQKKGPNKGRHFQQALLDGSTTHVAQFIKNGVDVNQRKRHNDTALHQACSVKHNKDVIKLLIDVNADVNAANSSGNTPIHVLIQSGTLDAASLLRDAGADVDAANQNGCTPLHLLMTSGTSEDVQLLIDLGADVNVKNNTGDTPLHVMCQQLGSSRLNCWTVMKLDHEASSPPNQVQQSSYAESKNDLSIYETVMDKTSILLKSGADVNTCNSDGNTSLHVACMRSSSRLIEMLLSSGANIEVRNCQGHTPLHKACASHMLGGNAITTARALISHGADATSKTLGTNQTCLHLMADSTQYYYKTLMELVVQKGCSLNARDVTGSTALHVACKKSQRGHVTVLLAMNPDVNVLDNDGMLAFFYLKQDQYETSPVLKFLQTDIDFTRYRIDEHKCTFAGMVYMRWAECIKAESVWPNQLYAADARDAAISWRIIVSSSPVLPLNVDIDITKVSKRDGRSNSGLDKLNTRDVPSLKIFSRAVVRSSIAPGRSLLPLIKPYLCSIALPRSVSEFIFMYEEAMEVFRDDASELRKLFPF